MGSAMCPGEKEDKPPDHPPKDNEEITFVFACYRLFTRLSFPQQSLRLSHPIPVFRFLTVKQ